MTVRALFGLLFAATLAPAAPVPGAKLTKEQAAEFDRLWERAARWDRPDDVKLACRMLVQPKAATEFLKGKLQPFTHTVKQIEDLIAKLDSEKESEWKPAFEELRVYDVRLGMTLLEGWELAKTARQKNRLCLIWHLQGFGMPVRDREKELERLEGCTFALVPPARGQTKWQVHAKGPSHNHYCGMELSLGEWVKTSDNAFDRRRIHLGLQILEQIGTPDAEAVVKRMTTGHTDVGPTKDAVEVAARLKAKPAAPAESRMVVGLQMLRSWQSHETKHLPDDIALFLARPDRAIAFLKPKLWPLKLDPKRAERLLTDLFTDNESVWKPAFDELTRYDFRLALPLREVWAKAETPDHRVRLKRLLLNEASPDDRFCDYRLTSEAGDDYLLLRREKRAGIPDDQLPEGLAGSFNGGTGVYEEVSRIGSWSREESAIHILDAIGTDDALAVIKDMATGHPDAAPTKAAVEVLKRRSGK